MPKWATVPFHCTKPCKDLDMPFRKKKSLPYCPKRRLCYLQLLSWAKRKLTKRAANCPQGLIVSRLEEQSWPLQQDVFKTKLWQSCGGVHVKSFQYSQQALWTRLPRSGSSMHSPPSRQAVNSPTSLHGITSRHETRHLRLVSCVHQHGGVHPQQSEFISDTYN